MIDKNIFYIWIGDKLPNYLIFSMKKFKSINPDFKIILIHKTITEFENLFYIEDTKKLSKINKIINFHSKIAYKKILYEKTRIPIITRTIDSMRAHVLECFGGIYLDCDMFPVKPFDNFLLNRKCFHTKRIHKINGKNIEILEEEFFGCSKFLKYRELKKDVIGCIEEFKKTKDLQDKFNNGTLEIGDSYSDPKYNNYVEHYGQWSWNPNNCKVPRTKMDIDIENKIKIGLNFV